MNEFLDIEDLADSRSEEPAKVARMLTRKECKLYLDLGKSEDPILCMTEYLNEKGNYSIYQVTRGVFPMTLKAQHKYVRRISVKNFDLTGLHFISGDDKRLRYLHEEDRTVKVVVRKTDIELLSKSSTTPKNEPINKSNKRIEKFADNNFHELVLRAVEIVFSKSNKLNWNDVRISLQKCCLEEESIQFIKDFNVEGDTVNFIHFKAKKYMEPYKITESYFKKTLSAYRKNTRR